MSATSPLSDPSREKKCRDNAMVRMGYIVTAAFILYVAAITFLPVSTAMDKVLLGTILGILGGQFAQVVSYYYGTSKGSADKAEQLADK